MLPEETLQKLRRHNFDFLARQEPSSRKRLRYMGLAHLINGRTVTEFAAALRVTRHTVMRWLNWCNAEGIQRLKGGRRESRPF